MRNHGWHLPYHPLQVVAVSVFLALGFAFYVFFSPFTGKKFLEHLAIGLYTPLLASVFGLYIWCAGSDPADEGVFKSRKYLKLKSPEQVAKEFDETKKGAPGSSTERKNSSNSQTKTHSVLLLCNKHGDPHESEEDGMFYCTLCEVEVFKYSKHCRVCDKCVDHFDHHCRWLNNCIGKKNYRKFFALMVFTLLLLIIQCSTGVLVLVCCFLERKHYGLEISSKLGSSFSLVPFVIVVAVCTVLAMIATLPVAQLFCFHVLLVKKGISTYDYIMAMREQEQQGIVSQQSPAMSPASSVMTGLSSASSMRGAWCTPPPLLLEDQFDVVPPVPELTKKKRPIGGGEVKISPWTLARMNADEVSRAAAEARKKQRTIQQPVHRRINAQRQHRPPVPKRRAVAGVADVGESTSLAPLQLEARSAFRTSRAMSSSTTINLASSPESSLGSPQLMHPLCCAGVIAPPSDDDLLSKSTSDGYDASGGEDSEPVSVRASQRSVARWNSGSDLGKRIVE